jgi:hypothetical protein
MTTPEGLVKAKVKTRLDAWGAWYFMPVAGVMGRIGIPDFIGCLGGRFFAIETKSGKGKTTRIQDMILSRIRHAGGIALVVNEQNMNDFLLDDEL